MLRCRFNEVCKNFAKKRLQHRCFPVNIVKFLRTPTFEKHLPKTASIYESWVAVQCWFQTLSVFFYYGQKRTNVEVRSFLRSFLIN